MGMFSILSILEKVMFDSGASLSYISVKAVERRNLPTHQLKKQAIIQSSGGPIKVTHICPQVPVRLCGVIFKSNLIVLPSLTLDVILGMDWLTSFKGVIDCANRVVTVTICPGFVVPIEVDQDCFRWGRTVNYLTNLPAKCVSVVEEFLDVFPEEIPGTPPDRGIEFIIDLAPGTALIAKRPHQMPANELEELKKQIKKMQDQGFIQPSSSLGVPLSCSLRKMMVA